MCGKQNDNNLVMYKLQVEQTALFNRTLSICLAFYIPFSMFGKKEEVNCLTSDIYNLVWKLLNR